MTRFSETLLEHARHPRNCGRDDQADRVGQADLAGGPPRIELFLRVDGDTVVQAKFQAAGCGVTVGACSALTEIVCGRRVASAVTLDTEELAAALDGVPGGKRHVLEIAVAALRDALQNTGPSSSYI